MMTAAALLLTAAIAILTISNSRIRREVIAKDAALGTARQAVDQMLLRVANEKLSNMPLGHPLRAELLQDALTFYEGFLEQGSNDNSLREEMASVLNSQGCIERELGRCDDACRSFERSIAMLQSIAASDPSPPALREKIVAAQEALAYTWKINPSASDRREADKNFRRALAMYQQLEHDWPKRRQPVGHCLRHLADLAYLRGDSAEAERFWRESIAKGEAYLEQQPSNLDARSNLCWACADISDSILLRSDDKAAAAEPFLKKGLAHASIMQQQDARSNQSREVAAFLRFCLARCRLAAETNADSLPLFLQAATEMHGLCADFPWNPQYWDLARYFHRETVYSLQQANRPDDSKKYLAAMREWLPAVASKIPEEPALSDQVAQSRANVANLLRVIGEENDANELERLPKDDDSPRN
jgi:tetratricopeptide (TPR) repeat protein